MRKYKITIFNKLKLFYKCIASYSFAQRATILKQQLKVEFIRNRLSYPILLISNYKYGDGAKLRGYDFSLRHHVQICSGAHPDSCAVGTGGCSPRVKRQGREADHSPPSSAEVKNSRSYTSTPQYVFMAWCLIKQLILLHCVVLS
jgi:hypothetical protein